MRLFSWLESIRRQTLSRARHLQSTNSRRRRRPLGAPAELLETRVLLTADFGDATVPYPTTAAENGAQHEATGPMLGTIRDSEADGVHSPTADADDTAGTPSDEDGVTFGTIRVGALGTTATVVVSNAPSGAKLDAWIDFNHDGNWGGSQEQIANSFAVVNGNNTITFDIPGDAVAGTTFARFRLSTVGNLGPNGSSSDGEIEDYSVTVIPPIESSGLFSTPNPVSTRSSMTVESLGDLDDDGDLDIVAVGYNGLGLTWFENDGRGVFAEHIVVAGNSPLHTSVRVADLDGDSDTDLVVTVGNGSVAWYENNGQQNFLLRTIASSTGELTDLAVADMDNDGDLDVLTSSYLSQRIAWYENDGLQQFSTHVVATALANLSEISVGDLDRDGDNDINFSIHRGLFTPTSPVFQWLENDGHESFTTRSTADIVQSPHSVRVADLIDFDRDGDLDVVVLESNIYDQYDNSFSWYENTGGQAFLKHTIQDHLDIIGNFLIADIDGDADLDVVYSSGYDYRIYRLQNSGDGSFAKQAVGYAAYTTALLAGDIDGNGTSDVVVSLSLAQSAHSIVWLSNRIDATPPSVQITPVAATNVTGPIPFSFQFSEPVTGFTASDISVSNGSVGIFTVVDATTYSLAVTPNAGGPVNVAIAAGVAQDVAGNGNLATCVRLRSR
jgi:hypothetical protein